MRGSIYAAADYDEPREWGFAIVPCDELRTWTPERYAAEVTGRLGDGPAYLSFDVDVLDPAFAPGTGTPETAGLLPHEVLSFLRSLAGTAFVGFDVVEVSPPYDGPGQVTALQAATVAFEMLALTAIARRGAAG
jgi:agmatinase